MNRTTRILLMSFFIATLAASLVPEVQARTCSNATGAGKWAFTVTGTIVLPSGAAVPVAQVGSYTQDRAGNIVGTQTRSLGGSVGDETFTSTVSTNPDCTAKATLYAYDKLSGALVRTSTLDVVFVDDGREARSIVTSIVLPNGANLGPVLIVEHKRVFPNSLR
ncbi:MAG: hypothetical protein LAO56_24610 [Acidobacteriia bacterium]|nr:hypothetical protein [Terriglobia bacterium]